MLRADRVAVETSEARRAKGAPALAAELRGASVVADTFAGRARAAQTALLDGMVGAVFAPGGTPRAAFTFRVEAGRIVEIDIVADPARLGDLDVVIIDGPA